MTDQLGWTVSLTSKVKGHLTPVVIWWNEWEILSLFLLVIFLVLVYYFSQGVSHHHHDASADNSSRRSYNQSRRTNWSCKASIHLGCYDIKQRNRNTQLQESWRQALHKRLFEPKINLFTLHCENHGAQSRSTHELTRGRIDPSIASPKSSSKASDARPWLKMTPSMKARSSIRWRK